ncbi:spermatogenesis-associated protein 16 [Saguinus oedipus]|uniref:Spermatogenesis-associated protein 16 n=1 Tax=Saguinus oedipus TaxID=9490 RepID=A0ABQ9U0S7_SAGOE|nr:spermatogenesis-associated protein 16 [Saguinus oedipus]
MDADSSRSLENEVKRIYHDQLVPKINTSKKMSTFAHPPNVLEMPQEMKKSCGDKQVEITPERTKMTKSIKEKQSNDLEKVAFKRKAEGEEKPAGKKAKAAKIIEADNQLITMSLPHIPLKNIMDVEMKLVYVDEDSVSYEFVESFMSTGSQPTCQAAEIVDPLSVPNFSSPPQIDKWLQVALKDASSCYRQKKYAMAAGQFRTALEMVLAVPHTYPLTHPTHAKPPSLSHTKAAIDTAEEEPQFLFVCSTHNTVEVVERDLERIQRKGRVEEGAK